MAKRRGQSSAGYCLWWLLLLTQPSTKCQYRVEYTVPHHHDGVCSYSRSRSTALASLRLLTGIPHFTKTTLYYYNIILLLTPHVLWGWSAWADRFFDVFVWMENCFATPHSDAFTQTFHHRLTNALFDQFYTRFYVLI